MRPVDHGGEVRQRDRNWVEERERSGGILDMEYQLLHLTWLEAGRANTTGQIVNLCFLVITLSWS